MKNNSSILPNAETAISKTNNVCGGSACIRSTRIPVWSLVLWRQQGVTDSRLLEMFPILTQGDLDAAWLYNASHREEIDQDIQSNGAGQNKADDDIRGGRLKSFEEPADLIDSLKKPW